MNALTAAIGVLAALLMIIGFWRDDKQARADAAVVWIIDTIVWLIFTFMLVYWSLIEDVAQYNTYLSSALGLLGVAMVFLGVYKGYSATVAILHFRQGPPPLSYDEEKEQNKRHILDITRRRPPNY